MTDLRALKKARGGQVGEMLGRLQLRPSEENASRLAAMLFVSRDHRRAIGRALRAWYGTVAIPALRRELQRPHSIDEKYVLAKLLCRLGERIAFLELVRLCAIYPEDVPSDARKMIGQLVAGSEYGFEEELRLLLRDVQPSVRLLASNWTFGVARAETLSVLQALARDRSIDRDMRNTALKSLAKCAPGEALELLASSEESFSFDAVIFAVRAAFADADSDVPETVLFVLAASPVESVALAVRCYQVGRGSFEALAAIRSWAACLPEMGPEAWYVRLSDERIQHVLRLLLQAEDEVWLSRFRSFQRSHEHAEAVFDFARKSRSSVGLELLREEFVSADARAKLNLAMKGVLLYGGRAADLAAYILRSGHQELVTKVRMRAEALWPGKTIEEVVGTFPTSQAVPMVESSATAVPQPEKFPLAVALSDGAQSGSDQAENVPLSAVAEPSLPFSRAAASENSQVDFPTLSSAFSTDAASGVRTGSPQSASQQVASTQYVRTVTLRERDTEVVKRVKEAEDNSCQICDRKLFDFLSNRPYSEAHHVQPLSHDGADAEDNVACLCPLCHRLLHLGAIGVTANGTIVRAVGVTESFRNSLRLSSRHKVNTESWRYHWLYMFRRPTGVAFQIDDAED
ncbi:MULTISPECIES: HNH endonuclease [Myxococcus]|uniref:HNH endonuclease n=1 Tax=Myxococcus TaxID=32 RepID=UPI001141A0C6|nr:MULTISPECIES: HNH endonuclease [Myxococcus]NOK04697.1 hypothetical protein [Myxococcus xanthus]